MKCSEEQKAYMRSYGRTRRKDNPEWAKTHDKLHYEKYREAYRLASRAHYKKNRETIKAKAKAYAERRFFWVRSNKLRGDGRAVALSLWGLWKKQRGLCALTNRKLDRTAELDHIIPRSRGGSDAIDNLRWLCKEANQAKRHFSDLQFLKLCQDIVVHSSERKI